VVRGTPLVRRGRGLRSYWPFNIFPVYKVSKMGPASSDGTQTSRDGTRKIPNGTQSVQWDPNFPNRTHISQMGPYWLRGHMFTGVGIPASFRCVLTGDDGESRRFEYDGEKRPITDGIAFAVVG
jgi:hypothetical protein